MERYCSEGMASGSERSTVDWAGRGFQMGVHQATSDRAEGPAKDFLEECGIPDPTPDAIAQLLDVFVPCLQIMCERGYDPTGATWREGGWRSQLVDIRKKFSRLWRHGWLQGKFVPDHGLDLINYTAFYQRMEMKGEPWGNWGQPEGE